MLRGCGGQTLRLPARRADTSVVLNPELFALTPGHGLGFEPTRQQAELFWSRVDTTGDGCWPYRADSPGRRGRYGHVRIYLGGRDVYAHRAAFVLQGGVIDSEVVLHACDRGWCMRGDHLASSTIAENNRQRDERARRTPFLPRGAASWAARFSDREADAIRTARELGVPAKALARMFNCSPATIYNVWNNLYYEVSPARSA